MGKFTGILICTDLDGTLYRNDKSISEENREAIEYFKREGGYFTFITGRMPYYSVDAYDAASPNVPYGCVNGGCLYDGATREYISTTALDDVAVELVEYIDKSLADVGIQVCCFDKTYFARENSATDRFRRITRVPKISVDYRANKEPVAKYIFCTENEETMQKIETLLLNHSLADRYSFIRSERTLFELLPKGVHKGIALTRLAEHLGIDVAKTVAVGDYNNDVGMLITAGVGVAVANASAAALNAADIVTVSNEEHAIARIIYDIESGKISFPS